MHFRTCYYLWYHHDFTMYHCRTKEWLWWAVLRGAARIPFGTHNNNNSNNDNFSGRERLLCAQPGHWNSPPWTLFTEVYQMEKVYIDPAVSCKFSSSGWTIEKLVTSGTDFSTISANLSSLHTTTELKVLFRNNKNDKLPKISCWKEHRSDTLKLVCIEP